MKTPVLETERLILRPVTLDDAPAIQKYFNNWNIIKNLSMVVPWPYPEDGAETFLRDIALPKVESGESHIWGITIKDGPDEIVGVVDYHKTDDNGEGNRGFWLAEDFWGRGYMSEAVTAVQDWLFFELGIEKMTLVNDQGNIGSRRVKEKTGARFIGTGTLEHRGGGNISEIWELTAESWREYRARRSASAP